MTHKIHDGTQDRDMTDDEIAELEKLRAELAKQYAAIQSKNAAAVSAKEKLADLGLTNAEIAALMG
jgi:hypothetical protein